MSVELPEKLVQAVAYARIALPHLAGAVATLDIRLDERIETACIAPSGRIIFAPKFVEGHSMRELGFVVAHEFYHALYGVFDRFDPDMDREAHWLVNVAHDFIVNEMLAEHLGEESKEGFDWDCDHGSVVWKNGEDPVPKDMLRWRNYRNEYQRLTGRMQPPLESYTLESLVVELRGLLSMVEGLPSADSPFVVLDRSAYSDRPIRERPSGCGRDGLGAGEGPIASAASECHPESPIGGASRKTFRELFVPPANDEFMSDDGERKMFPEEPELERRARRERFQLEMKLGNDEFRKAVSNLASRGGHMPGTGEALVRAFAGEYRLPWEAALQKGIEDFTCSRRTWARASRRGGDRTDVVLSGHANVGCRLNIVADTSGSMVSVLPMVLGLVQSFGRAAGLSVVRIVQCDSEVQADDVVSIDELSQLEMKGMGGGMNPSGMLRMSEDPLVERVLVLTDGYIEIPPEAEVPYEVTWCLLTEGGATDHFTPSYGSVIGIPIDDFLKENGVS